MKLLYALIITSFFVVQSFARLRTLFHTLGRSRRADLQSNYKYATKTFEVPLDHFSFATNATFNIRYLVNDTWQKTENPPIFFYTGNEGSIEEFAENTGLMWDIAGDFGALLIFAEHRYYGESFPSGNKSFGDPKYAGYLNSYQALADYVKLIEYLKSDTKYNASPVITFGGSYGGMLSAWIRMKYPHVVHGAVASSAPVLQFTGVTDCEIFARIVTSDFRSANPQCSKAISKSWTTINNVTSTDEGKKWISENWNLCTAIKNASDVQALKDWLTDVYSNLAMVNYPYPTNFLIELPGNPVLAFCKKLPNSSLSGKPLLTALFNAVSIYTNYTGKVKCNDFKGDSAPNLHADGWPYQACTEMVMPMCSDGVNDMFELVPWNLQKYSDECYKAFKVRPDPDLVCQRYGCKDISTASNIIFSNGLLDPWSGGGVLNNVSSTVLAIIIPEGAHHLDLRGHNPQDPFSVVQTRKFIQYTLRNWLSNYHPV